MALSGDKGQWGLGTEEQKNNYLSQCPMMPVAPHLLPYGNAKSEQPEETLDAPTDARSSLPLR
ncbi:hypothetical protein GS682_12055 [Nostoc sp. B(2019)]|nr:hypothetical protein [Nostoc sp. B(2019)]